MIRYNGKSKQRRTQAATAPAPVKGINASQSLAEMDPTDALYLYNLLPTEIGLQTRLGYREWATGMVPTLDGILTIIPFTGMVGGVLTSKLFAACNRGVYDITDSTAAPAEVYVWPDRSELAGYCSYAPYTSQNSDTFLLVADWVNGLVEYDASTETWAPSTITGVDVGTLNFVVNHHNRFWFVQRASADAWFLDPGVKAGAATRYPFGSAFAKGGDLVGLYPWTNGDGSGLNDDLVVVSRAGDVLHYRGTDPTLTTSWARVGRHAIGRIPAGNRVAAAYGADLFLLSRYGLVSMRDLSSLENAAMAESPTKRVEPIIRTQMGNYLEDIGWEVTVLPGSNTLSIVSPWVPGRTTYPVQFTMSLSTGAWGISRGMDLRTVVEHRSNVYWGDMVKGTVYVMIDGPDNVLLDGSGGYPVQFSSLTAYTGMGAPANTKIVHMIRARFLSDTSPAMEHRAFYNYDLTVPPTAPPYQESEFSAWDVSLWDSGVWVSAPYGKDQKQGSSGIGHMVAIASRGQTTQRVTMVQYDAMAELASGYI